jgi:hypothetical protein
MSEKNQPKFDKDIELAKINLVAEEWRGNKLLYLGTLLSAFVAVLALSSAARFANQISFLQDDVVIVVTIIIIAPFAYFTQFRPYERRLGYLGTLLRRVNAGETIGDVDDLLKMKKA